MYLSNYIVDELLNLNVLDWPWSAIYFAGTCKCRTGYLGEDCAIHETDPPDIIGIPDNGLCDLSERPCEQTAVIGKKFVDGKLQCRLVPFKVVIYVQIELIITNARQSANTILNIDGLYLMYLKYVFRFILTLVLRIFFQNKL